MGNYCLNCGIEQGYIGEISDYIVCERCGSYIYADGSCGSNLSQQDFQDNIEFYDGNFRDRKDFERNRYNRY